MIKMKHNVKITILLLLMFFVTQLIGLLVVKAYLPKEVVLPFGFEPPEMSPGVSLVNILVAMAIAIVLIFLLMKIRAALFLRLWFFFVVTIAMAVTFNAFLMGYLSLSTYIALIIAIPLGFLKIFRRNILVHNFTELLIYPGIAAIFVPILNLWAIMVLLILISIYDIYAVWHSGFMQKMAKFQINSLRVFAGFFVPYMSKKQAAELKAMKGKKLASRNKKKMKISLAILGGGDVIFPIITAGVVMASMGAIAALIVSVFATLALLYLFMAAKKEKFYPAMPFLTAGLFVGIFVAYLVTRFLL